MLMDNDYTDLRLICSENEFPELDLCTLTIYYTLSYSYLHIFMFIPYVLIHTSIYLFNNVELKTSQVKHKYFIS